MRSLMIWRNRKEKDVNLMSELERLLDRAFENKSGKNRYQSGEYAVAFEERAFETLFWIYENNIPVIQGNLLDKEIEFCNKDMDTQKYISAIRHVLADYDFHTRTENAEYISVWDNAIITSHCQIRLNDGKVMNMEENDYDGDDGELEILEDEYVILNGVEFPVQERHGEYFVSFEEELEREQVYKCCECGEEFSFDKDEYEDIDEVLLGHIQLNHDEIWEECQDWEAPSIIEEYFNKLNVKEKEKSIESFECLDEKLQKAEEKRDEANHRIESHEKFNDREK